MRDALIVGIACVVAIVAGAWLFFMDEGSQAPRPVDVAILGEGPQAIEVAERKNYRIRSSDELRELWSMTYGPAAPPHPRCRLHKLRSPGGL